MASKLPKNLQIGIGVGIVALISLVILLATKEKPATFRDVIDKKLSEDKSLDAKRKSQLKIQLAVNDFQIQNDGRLPQSLTELIPTYFDTIPVDPDTGKPFEYRVVNGMARVGSDESTTKTANKGSGKKTSQGGIPTDMSEEEATALIASLEESEEQVAYVYDPTGKRDPFAPYNAAPKTIDDENKTELEKISIGQLRLTAILDGFDDPKAMVETSTGKGYTIGKGTKIGTNSGEVIEILSDKVLILETTTDFTGEQKTRTVEMKLPVSSAAK